MLKENYNLPVDLPKGWPKYKTDWHKTAYDTACFIYAVNKGVTFGASHAVQVRKAVKEAPQVTFRKIFKALRDSFTQNSYVKRFLTEEAFVEVSNWSTNEAANRMTICKDNFMHLLKMLEDGVIEFIECDRLDMPDARGLRDLWVNWART